MSNSNFEKNRNTVVQESAIANSVNELVNSKFFHTSFISLGSTLTDGQIMETFGFPGLRVNTFAGGAISFGVDTPERARELLDLLDLKTMSDGRVLTFYTHNSILGVLTIGNSSGTSVSLQFRLLDGGVLDTAPISQVTVGAGINGIARVLALPNSFTAGSESIQFQVIQVLTPS
jgi:hypothetical protein